MRLIDADDIPYVDLNGDMPASGVHVWVAFKDRIDSMPTIGISAIEERKKGKWIYHSDWEADGECCYECSECGMGSDVDYSYCMRCGADTRGEQDANANA